VYPNTLFKRHDPSIDPVIQQDCLPGDEKGCVGHHPDAVTVDPVQSIAAQRPSRARRSTSTGRSGVVV
jgi:hypothetical protein